MTTVFVHGFPETVRIWDSLRGVLGGDSVALSLPGFGAARPAGFSATKDAYADWLADELAGVDGPIDLVGHDVGALLALRVVTAYNTEVRSFAVDVAPIFHPDFEWAERVHRLQTPGVGEDLMKAMREADPQDPGSTASRLAAAGVPVEEARAIGATHDETMSRCILDFYRSAAPNVGADWWGDVTGPTRSRGLVLLLPDPPEEERMSLDVAGRLGAETARLGELEHCWMAEDPQAVAEVLQRFWAS
ncbi:MAG TPA: alpha/beta hydrolase [Micromonosporaceae bacterium]|nr:alpha/beta hydrolase [Micromonosporaceae bacterium]